MSSLFHWKRNVLQMYLNGYFKKQKTDYIIQNGDIPSLQSIHFNVSCIDVMYIIKSLSICIDERVLI